MRNFGGVLLMSDSRTKTVRCLKSRQMRMTTWLAILATVFVIMIEGHTAQEEDLTEVNWESSRCPDGTFIGCEHGCTSGHQISSVSPYGGFVSPNTNVTTHPNQAKNPRTMKLLTPEISNAQFTSPQTPYDYDDNVPRIDSVSTSSRDKREAPSDLFCTCSKGYELEPNQSRKCKPVYPGDGQFLLATHFNERDILYVNLTTTREDEWRRLFTDTHIFSINNRQNITGLEYDDSTGNLYWYNKYEKEIQSGSLPLGALVRDVQYGSDVISVKTKNVIRSMNDLTAKITGIGIDPIADVLYYANSYLGIIAAMRINGDHHKVLIQGRKDINFFTVSSALGTLAWIEQKFSTIYIAACDGSNVTKISFTEVYTTTALAIDEKDSKLYWIHDKGIESIYLNGSGRRIVRNGSEVTSAFTLATDGYRLYWTDVITQDVLMAPITGNFSSQSVAIDKWGVYDFLQCGKRPGTDKSPPVEPGNGAGPCADHPNGGCQHLCLPISRGLSRRCACADGYVLGGKDETSCLTEAPIDDFLIMADGQLKRIFVVNLAQPSFFRAVHINSSERPVALKYDPLSKNFLWSDIGNKNFEFLSISPFVRFKGLNGEPPKPDVSDVSSYFRNGTFTSTIVPKTLRKQKYSYSVTDGMALEPIRRLLYYSDTGANKIGVYDLEGAYNKYIITTDLDQPRAIALHRIKGLMFWTDWGENSKIESATMAGTNRQLLVGKNIGWPNGLIIDIKGDRLYWIDAKLDHIASCATDGASHTVHRSIGKHGFSLAVSPTHFYWTDWLTNTVRRLGRSDMAKGDIEDIVAPTFSRLLDIDVFVRSVWEEELQRVLTTKGPWDGTGAKWTDGCFYPEKYANGSVYEALGNGACSQFCFPMPGNERRCDCRDGDTLDPKDAKTCLGPNGGISPANFARRNPDIYLSERGAARSTDFYTTDTYGESVVCTEQSLVIPPNVIKVGCTREATVWILPNVTSGTPATTATPTNGNYNELKCVLRCADGFDRVSGDTVRTCYVTRDLKDIVWPGLDLDCQATKCDTLSAPPNSDMVQCDREYDSECIFRCIEGAEYISGDQIRTCQLDGKWSGSPIVCRGSSCTYPGSANTRVTSCPKEPKEGDTCRIECLPGFTKVSGSEEVSCQAGATWSGPPLECSNNQSPDVRSCPKLVVPVYAENISCANLDPGSECNYRCSVGKNRLSGSEVRKCSKDGVWNGFPLVCSECPILPDLNNYVSLYANCSLNTQSRPVDGLEDVNAICDIGCRAKYWENVVPVRPNKMVLICQGNATKASITYNWNVTAPNGVPSVPNQLLPVCGQTSVPKNLSSQIVIGLKRRSISSSESEKNLENLPKCGDLIPQVWDWFVTNVLRLNETVFARNCTNSLIYDPYAPVSPGKSAGNCPWSTIALRCKDGNGSSIFLNTEDTIVNVPFLMDIISNPRLPYNRTDLVEFWRGTIITSLKTYNQTQAQNFVLKEPVLAELPLKSSSEYIIAEPSPPISKVGPLSVNCLAGHASASKSMCVRCPRGTKLDDKLRNCQLCPVGYYQNKPAQTACLKCLGDSLTEIEGARDISQCQHLPEIRKRKKSYSGIVLFVVLMTFVITIIVGVYCFFRDKGLGFRSTTVALWPLPSVFKNSRQEPHEMSNVPYGSFA